MSDPNQPHEPHDRHGYDPNQPRVPAGQSTGGQWTDTDGPNVDGAPQRKVVRDTSGQEAWNFYYNMYRPDGSLAEQVVFNRDRSRIISEFNEPGDADDWDERHTVITPDGNKFTFKDHGDNQIAYDGGDGRPSETASSEHGSEERPVVQKAFLPAVAAPAIIGVGEGIGIAAAGLALLTWLSRRNSREGTYVLSFSTDLLQRADVEKSPEGAGHQIDGGRAQEGLRQVQKCSGMDQPSGCRRQTRAEGLEAIQLWNRGAQTRCAYRE
jgi:hypothetical protein